MKHTTHRPAAPCVVPRSTLATEFNGEVAIGVPQPKAVDQHAEEGAIGINNNNYVRDQGQNVG